MLWSIAAHSVVADTIKRFSCLEPSIYPAFLPFVMIVMIKVLCKGSFVQRFWTVTDRCTEQLASAIAELWNCHLHTLRRDSSLHCISSAQAVIQLYKDGSRLTEMKIYSGVSYYFWECMVLAKKDWLTATVRDTSVTITDFQNMVWKHLRKRQSDMLGCYQFVPLIVKPMTVVMERAFRNQSK